MEEIRAEIVSGILQGKEFLFEDEILNLYDRDINILFTLEEECYRELQDTINYNWKIVLLHTMQDVEPTLKKYEDRSIQNIALVHHGNRYTPKSSDTKVILNASYLNTLKQVDDYITDKEQIEDNKKYLEKMQAVNTQRFGGEIPQEYLIAYLYFKQMLSAIADGGNYFSIACDEADDESTLKLWGELAKNDIKLYGNSKFTVVSHRDKREYTYKGKQEDIKIQTPYYSSILNIPLTINWYNDIGWKYYDISTNQIVTTHKDLVLHSNRAPFSFIKGKKDQQEEEKFKYAQQYYSKRYKKWYINHWGNDAYEKWKSGVQKNYNL